MTLPHDAPASSTRSPFHPILVFGLGSTVAVWIAALIFHLPWIAMKQSVAGPAVLVVWLLAAVQVGRISPGSFNRRLLIGAGSGLLCALANLLILGSLLVRPQADNSPAPGTSGLIPDAGLIMLGFVVLGVLLGGAGTVIGGFFSSAKSRSYATLTSSDWLTRLALVVAISTIPLLVVGGSVTSANAGMAIVGWPDSYGANMFLYPVSLMTEHPQRFFEHSHRLFGSLVGLCSVILLFATLFVRKDKSTWLFAAFLFVLVVIQGLLGAKRVLDGANVDLAQASRAWGLVHGILAQLFFAASIAFVARLARPYALLSSAKYPPLRLPFGLCLTLVGALFIQLAMGATYRHMEQMHALWTHAGFALVVLMLSIITGSLLRKAAGESDSAHPLRRQLNAVGAMLIHGTGLQFALGFAALAAVLLHPDKSIPIGDAIKDATQVPIWQGIVRTIHQANGAIILAAATLALFWAVTIARKQARTSV